MALDVANRPQLAPKYVQVFSALRFIESYVLGTVPLVLGLPRGGSGRFLTQCIFIVQDPLGQVPIFDVHFSPKAQFRISGYHEFLLGCSESGYCQEKLKKIVCYRFRLFFRLFGVSELANHGFHQPRITDSFRYGDSTDSDPLLSPLLSRFISGNREPNPRCFRRGKVNCE